VTQVVPPGPVLTPTPKALHAKLKAAAHQLESVFYGQLFQAMRATIPESGLVPTDSGEKVFTGMLDDQFSQLASSRTDRGLAGAIYKELSRHLPPDVPASPTALPPTAVAAAATPTAKPADE